MSNSDPLLSADNKVVQGKYCKIVQPNQAYRGMTYSDFIEDYFNWIYSQEPDLRQGGDVTFLRGNVIGDPYKVYEQPIQESGLEVLTDPRYVYDRTNLRGITIRSNSAIFIDVFDTLFVVGDHFRAKQLDSPFECRIAAREEFGLISGAWATIERLEPQKEERIPIVGDLARYYCESSPISISVSEANKLNREPDFYLQGGQYVGVSAGIFLLISSLDIGKYQIDFGGTQNTNYFTRSVYDVNVVSADDFKVPDMSKNIKGFPYPKISKS